MFQMEGESRAADLEGMNFFFFFFLSTKACKHILAIKQNKIMKLNMSIMRVL